MKHTSRFISYVFLLTIVFLCMTDALSNRDETQVKKAGIVDWENPAVVGLNKESAHCTYIPFADRDSVLKNDRTASTYFMSLNGIWKFNWVRKPADRPLDFFAEDFDVRLWQNIQVPGNWELQDFGVPIYTDVDYPFPANPPYIPHEYNPVGSYRRDFFVPKNWEGRQHCGPRHSAIAGFEDDPLIERLPLVFVALPYEDAEELPVLRKNHGGSTSMSLSCSPATPKPG